MYFLKFLSNFIEKKAWNDALKMPLIVSLMQTSISLKWKPNLPHVHQEGFTCMIFPKLFQINWIMYLEKMCKTLLSSSWLCMPKMLVKPLLMLIKSSLYWFLPHLWQCWQLRDCFKYINSFFLFVSFVVLHPSQQLWSCLHGQLTLPQLLGRLLKRLTSKYLVENDMSKTDVKMSKQHPDVMPEGVLFHAPPLPNKHTRTHPTNNNISLT